MKARHIALGVLALILVVGCVPSLNPVYTDRDVYFDPALLGTWVQEGDNGTWEFGKHDGKSYRLTITDKEGRQGRFVATLAKIDDTMFLDLYPEAVQSQSSDFYMAHHVSIHTIYMVKESEPTLTFGVMDLKWMNEYLADNPDALQCSQFNGRKLITAPTEQLQAFLMEHKDKFTGEFKLARTE